MRLRLRVVALAAALFVAVASGLDRTEAPLAACGPWREFPLFTALTVPERADFLDGKLGIIGAGYGTPYLVVAWRTFRGRPMSAAELAAPSIAARSGDPNLVPGGPEPEGTTSWTEIRRTLADAPKNYYYQQQWTATPRFDFFLNCAGDAFTTAARTLMERRDKLGAEAPEFVAWVQAQDQVFANCDWEQAKTPVIPPALSASASPAARADRDYQIAAALFYAGELKDAERAFGAIAQDATSPWHGYGAYLAARAIVRQGTVGGRESEHDPSAFPRAAAALDAILSDASLQSMHERARKLRQYVAVRWHPADALATAARSLSSPDSDTARVEQNLIDFNQLLDRAAKDTTGYRSTPADAATEDLVDWVRSFSSANDNLHAMERWHATRADYWLAAAVAATAPDSPNRAEVLAESATLRHDSPAFATVAYHRARLLLLTGDAERARAVLDAVLESGGLSPSAVNQFRSIRMQLARTLDEFLRDAPRTPVANWFDSDVKFVVSDNPREPVAYDRDAIDLLNERLPLAMLRRAAASPLMVPRERVLLAGSIFTRAVLLGDAALVRQVVAETRRNLPALRQALAPVAAATDDRDVLDEAWLVLAFHPGLRPYVPPDSYRDLPNLTAIDGLRDNWWCTFRAGDNSVRPYATQYLQGERRSDAMKALYTSATEVPTPAFLSADETRAARTEWERLVALQAGPTELQRHAISWAERHPDDPRAPRVLAQCVRIGHFGCGDASTGPLSKKAFTLLHQRYPNSEWAARTPYWYK